MKDAWIWAAGAECAYCADWHPGQICYWMLVEGKDLTTALLLDESNVSFFLSLMYSALHVFTAPLNYDTVAYFYTGKGKCYWLLSDLNGFYAAIKTSHKPKTSSFCITLHQSLRELVTSHALNHRRVLNLHLYDINIVLFLQFGCIHTWHVF